MRVVVAVKRTGGRGAARGARYIAERDRDKSREGAGPRPLFSDKEDKLTYRRADRILSGGKGTPEKKDLIHLAVSFQMGDYERLGEGDEDRKKRLREIARSALNELRSDLNSTEMRWVAGIHLNTDHPHLHILIHKEMTDRDSGDKRRLNRIPKGLLPHREQRPDGSMRSVEGRLGDHFVVALDKQIDRARLAGKEGRSQSVEAGKGDSFGEWLRTENKVRAVMSSWQREQDELPPSSTVNHHRIVLGDALEKRIRREQAERKYLLAQEHSDAYRFQANDASVDERRKISKLDVERRANARGLRAADQAGLVRAFPRREVRDRVASEDLALHEGTITEIEKIRQNVIERLSNELSRARSWECKAVELAAAIEKAYQSEGKELPTPFIRRGVIAELQGEAVRLGLSGQFQELEGVRTAIASVLAVNPRNDDEASRLATELLVTQTELRVKEERTKNFEMTAHLQRWEYGREKWSLAELDRMIERLSDESRIFGAHRLHFAKSERELAAVEAARLTRVRESVVEQIAERRSELNFEKDEIGNLVRILDRAYKDELAVRGKEGRSAPSLAFTAHELEAIEAKAATLLDADLLKQIQLFDRRSTPTVLSGQANPERDAGRALARFVAAEVRLRETQERMTAFSQRGELLPLAVTSHDGSLSVHRHREVQLNSIAEMVRRTFFDKAPEKRLRRSIEESYAGNAARLLSEHNKAEEYYRSAREIAAKTVDRISEKKAVELAFTPAEAMAVEIYAERQSDAATRDHYLNLVRGGSRVELRPGPDLIKQFGVSTREGGPDLSPDTSSRASGRGR